MKIKIIYCLIISVLIIQNSYCYVDIFSDFGYSKIKTPFNDNLELAQIGIGATLAYENSIMFGVTSEYSALLDITNKDSSVHFYKNQKKVTIAPIIGYKWDTVILKIYISNFSYSLLRQQKDQATTTSSDSKGFRIMILKKLNDNWAMGSSYSTEHFNKISLNTNDNSETVKNSANMVTASIVVAYIF